jgi:hypothetical protein
VVETGVLRDRSTRLLGAPVSGPQGNRGSQCRIDPEIWRACSDELKLTFGQVSVVLRSKSMAQTQLIAKRQTHR